MNSETNRGEIVLYQTADGRTSIDVKLENETVWLSKEQMAILFERDRTVISRHIKNIFQEGELDENDDFLNPESTEVLEDADYQEYYDELEAQVEQDGKLMEGV